MCTPPEKNLEGVYVDYLLHLQFILEESQNHSTKRDRLTDRLPKYRPPVKCLDPSVQCPSSSLCTCIQYIQVRSQLSKNDRKKFNSALIVGVHNGDIIDRFEGQVSGQSYENTCS